MVTSETPAFGVLLSRRAAVGLTQEELAERAGLSARGNGDLERGVRTRSRGPTLRQLAEVLRLSPDDRALFERAARVAEDVGTEEEQLPEGTFLGALPENALVGWEEERERISWWWVNNGNELFRVDPVTNKVVAAIPLDSSAGARTNEWCGCSSVAAANGTVWALAHDEHQLVRVDPRTNEITARLTIPAPRGVHSFATWDVAVGEGGACVNADPHYVIRVKPNGRRRRGQRCLRRDPWAVVSTLPDRRVPGKPGPTDWHPLLRVAVSRCRQFLDGSQLWQRRQ